MGACLSSCCNNVLTALICLYCRSGCRASAVASALTFHPPEPFYDLSYDESTDSYTLDLSEDLPKPSFQNLT